MSTVMISPTPIMTAKDISVDATSIPVHIMYADNIGIQFVWTGSPTGQFNIELSNTATLGATGTISGGTWTAMTGSFPAPSGSGGNGFVSLSNVCAAFIRVTYTHASGSGAATVTLTGKAI